MESMFLNGVKTYAPQSQEELITFAMDNNSILIALNGDKIHNATDSTRRIINKNVGYPDGMGVVWALKRKGNSNVNKIPGCELWLDLVREFHKNKSFYLIGGKQEVIEETVKKLRRDFPEINICNFRNISAH